MKKFNIIIALVLFTFSNLFGQDNNTGLKTEMDSVSYALGVAYSTNFVQQKVYNVNVTELEKGFACSQTKTETDQDLLSQEEVEIFLAEHKKKIESNNGDIKYSISLMNSISFSFGYHVSELFLAQGFNGFKSKIVAKGFEDNVNAKPIIDFESSKNIVENFLHQDVEKEKTENNLNSERIEIGNKFLADNGKRSEVVTLSSGLQYEILTEGKGDKPTMDNTVSTHYHGTLINGTVFDSSVERGSPLAFKLNQVIAGWSEVLQLMPVGSKWKVYIPYNLAYGERGSGSKIQPYSTLVFEIELLEITN